jgi:hypothetical protein
MHRKRLLARSEQLVGLQYLDRHLFLRAGCLSGLRVTPQMCSNANAVGWPYQRWE